MTRTIILLLVLEKTISGSPHDEHNRIIRVPQVGRRRNRSPKRIFYDKSILVGGKEESSSI